MMKTLLLISVVCCLQWPAVDGAYTFGDASILTANLSHLYSVEHRPSATTDVLVQMGLMHITDLNIVTQELTVGGFLMLKWSDSRLQWSPFDFGGLSDVLVYCSQIWTPTLMLSNAGDGIRVLSDDSDLATVGIRVYSSASVVWLLPVNFVSQCSINIQYYPFDYQECIMTVSSWMYTNIEVNIFTEGQTVNFDLYEENGEWEVYGTKVTNSSRILYGHATPAVNFKLQLIRKYSYYVKNLILPVIILALMGPFMFLLPVESGEKNGFALTIMLSLSVVMSTVAAYIPTTATHVCILSVYLLVTFVVCALQALVTVLTCRIHNFHSQSYVPSRWTQKILAVLAIITFYKRALSNEDAPEEKPRANSVSPEKIEKLKLAENNNQSKCWDEDLKTESERIEYTYEEFAMLLDRFNFTLFFLATVGITLGFMMYIGHGDSFDN